MTPEQIQARVEQICAIADAAERKTAEDQLRRDFIAFVADISILPDLATRARLVLGSDAPMAGPGG